MIVVCLLFFLTSSSTFLSSYPIRGANLELMFPLALYYHRVIIRLLQETNRKLYYVFGLAMNPSQEKIEDGISPLLLLSTIYWGLHRKGKKKADEKTFSFLKERGGKITNCTPVKLDMNTNWSVGIFARVAQSRGEGFRASQIFSNLSMSFTAFVIQWLLKISSYFHSSDPSATLILWTSIWTKIPLEHVQVNQPRICFDNRLKSCKRTLRRPLGCCFLFLSA